MLTRFTKPSTNTLRYRNTTVDRHRDDGRVRTRSNLSRPDIWIASLLLLLIAGTLGYLDIHAKWSRVPGAASLFAGTPVTDTNGVAYYPMRSAYQGFHKEVIRVLRPSHPRPGIEPSTLYVLPVDIGVDTLSSKWSDGLEHLRLLDVPNRFNMTLVAPSFYYIPWYGDNIHDLRKRMESFMVYDLVPFGDTVNPGGRTRRYLIGFSKSGDGALLLILRHPDIFEAAAAWDCPAELHSLAAFPNLSTNFADQANYDRYYIPALVADHAEAFRHRNRLWISGDPSIFTSDMIKLHDQLTALSIPHTWVQGTHREHNWGSGWLEGAVEGLAADSPGTTLTARAANQSTTHN